MRARVASLVAAVALVGPDVGVGGEKAQPEVLQLRGDLSPIHDPSIVKQAGSYYLFATARFRQDHLPMFCSADLRQWSYCGHVFDQVPEWALSDVPGARDIWAPDISYVRGQYRLYYAVSTFGSNRSVIGLATNETLDPTAGAYRWVDRGKVLESTHDDDWNAIDPNLVVDAEGRHWLAWGSFWGGIKMRRVEPETGKLSGRDTTLHSLASRRPLQPPAIEAPTIVRRGGYYYLFVSFDRCCRGKDSTYKIMVGRSRTVTGPYRDRGGTPMVQGGGTLVVEGNSAWRGPGHQAVLLGTPSDLLVFHAYHAETGRPHLKISTLTWPGGWPRAGALPATTEASP